MKAIIYRRYGTPDVMQLREQPVLIAGRGLVRVKVHATAINDWDWTLLRGQPHLLRLFSGPFKPKITILGTEVAGVVEALGEGVTRFAVGDRVYGDLSEAGFSAALCGAGYSQGDEQAVEGTGTETKSGAGHAQYFVRIRCLELHY